MRSPSGDTAIGRTYPQLPLFHQPESASAGGIFSNRSPFDGESRIYAYRRLPAQPDFIIAVGQSKALLTASWRNFTAISLTIWLFCCGAIVLLGSFLDRVWQQNQRGKEMLRTTSERLELATEAGVIGTFDLDLVHDRLHGSPTYWGQLGQAADAMATSRSEWLERVHPEDRPIVAENIRRATELDNSAFTHDIRVQHHDGSYRWMRETGRVMAHDADGRAMRLLGTRIDITEHKQREQRLIAAERSVRAGEQRYRMLFEHAPGGIGITTGDTRLTEVNAELCELLGYGREELIGKSIADLILPAQRKRIDSALQALMHGMGKRREWTLVHKSGATLVAEVVGTIMPDGRIMNLVHDVTQRKEGEEALRTLLQEQEALLREVHHRVKNNLQLIHSMLRLETSRCRFGEARAALRDMQERVQSIALLHGMLYRRGRFASVDLGSYLYHLCHEAMRAGNALARGIRLQLDLASVPLDMDQAMCCGLIVNELLSNCLKHAFPDRDAGQIRVQLQAVDGGARLQLRVSDDGVGFAGDPAHAPATTMGMQLVADLTLQLEGQLEVQAGPGAAYCVTFVPARPAQRTPQSDTLAQPSVARPVPTHLTEA
jgi:PAS domain S-box-containing protein